MNKILERLYSSNMPFEKITYGNSSVLSTWSNTIFRIAFYFTSMRITCKLVCWWWFRHLFKHMFAKFDIFHHFLRVTENTEHSQHVNETASSLIKPFCFHQLIRPKDPWIKSWQDLFGSKIISSYLIHSHPESLPSSEWFKSSCHSKPKTVNPKMSKSSNPKSP